MRVLCSAVPMEGHVRPLLPVALALAGAGHDVRLATGPDLHDLVRKAGLIPERAGPTGHAAFSSIERDPRFAELPITQRGAAAFSRVIAPGKLPDLVEIADRWQPDLIVHECTDLAAPIAAAVAGVPAVTQGWGRVPLPGLTVPDPADVLDLWRSCGHEPDAYAGIFGCIHLHPMPSSLEPHAQVPVGLVQPMRLEMPLVAEATLPIWADALEPARKVVIFVSLGTHAYFSRPEYFRTILDGLRMNRPDADVVVTVGSLNDPRSLGVQPRNVRVERWLPLPLLLPRCSLVICHAGSGTLLASLAAGLPLLLLPRGADQFENSAASKRAGVARVIAPEALTAYAIAEEVEQVLVTETYRLAAASVQAEIKAMPAPSDVVPLLEQLALLPARDRAAWLVQRGWSRPT